MAPLLRPLAALAPCLAALLAAPGPAAAAPPSHEIARVVMPGVARAAPRPGARAVARLTGATEFSRRPQGLLVTGRHRDRRGARWVRVQLPVRPNGTSGWVRAEAVAVAPAATRLVVRLGARRVELWRHGRRVARWRAGVGRPVTPTPTGLFAIQDPVRTLPAWRGIYGGHTLTLTAHSTVLRRFMGGDGRIALHGSGGKTWRVGQRSSNGCIILGEGALALAARHAVPGTPVLIVR